MLMRFSYLLCCLLISSVILTGSRPSWSQGKASSNAGAAQARPDDQVVISVGDEKVTAADLERMLAAMPPQYKAYYGGPGKPLLPQYIVQMKILATEAAKHKVAENPEVHEAIRLATDSILANAERKRIDEGIPVSDQQLQDLYESRKAGFEEVRIRHILLRTDKSVLAPAAAPSRPPSPEGEARKKLEDLRKQILGGADFAELARNDSEDLSTAGAGGDMGYVNSQTVVPPILNAAQALSVGQVSDIISTPYGLEIIKVDERRLKPLVDVKPELLAQIRQGKEQEIIAKLADQYHVVVDSQYFAPQKASSPPPSLPAPQK
jgi:parvulin-like peptidyl-prolyl isomerase